MMASSAQKSAIGTRLAGAPGDISQAGQDEQHGRSPLAAAGSHEVS